MHFIPFHDHRSGEPPGPWCSVEWVAPERGTERPLRPFSELQNEAAGRSLRTRALGFHFASLEESVLAGFLLPQVFQSPP